MSLELAKSILERELSQKEGSDTYQVDLVGGEPFFHFDEIKELVEYSKLHAALWNKKFFFVIGTNLTLLTPEIEQWLVENRKYVVLSTSLDGTREAHNHYRCDSYDVVVRNLPFYRQLYPSQGVKMTIGSDTISSIYDSILNIKFLDLPFVAANVVYKPVWGDLDAKKFCLREFKHQLELLVDYYADNPTIDPTKLLSLPIHKIMDKQDDDPRWCDSVVHMRAYDTEEESCPATVFPAFPQTRYIRVPSR